MLGKSQLIHVASHVSAAFICLCSQFLYICYFLYHAATELNKLHFQSTDWADRTIMCELLLLLMCMVIAVTVALYRCCRRQMVLF